MDEKTRETRVDRVPTDDGEVFRLTLPRVDVITLDHAREIAAATSRVAPGCKALFLIDARRAGRMTLEARRFLACDEATKNIRALAILADSPVSRVVGNFFLKIDRPKVPARLFGSETDAVRWLRGFER
jgi:hypothetical protein